MALVPREPRSSELVAYADDLTWSQKRRLKAEYKEGELDQDYRARWGQREVNNAYALKKTTIERHADVRDDMADALRGRNDDLMRDTLVDEFEDWVKTSRRIFHKAHGDG